MNHSDAIRHLFEESIRTKQSAGAELAEPISRGRNGMIYQALDTTRHQVVALKLFGRFGEERPEFVWKYLPGLEDARVLEHENIMSIRDVLTHVADLSGFTEAGEILSVA